MVTKEDREMLTQIGDKIDALIDKQFEKMALDRAYFNFTVKVDVMDSEFKKTEEMILIDDSEYSFCHFCGAKTFYHDTLLGMYLCAECFGKAHPKDKAKF